MYLADVKFDKEARFPDQRTKTVNKRVFLFAFFLILDCVADVQCFQPARLSTHKQVLQKLSDALVGHSIATNLEVADLSFVQVGTKDASTLIVQLTVCKAQILDPVPTNVLSQGITDSFD